MEEYENLANAIVLQAVKDWRASVKELKKNPGYLPAINMKKDCERFFLSGWLQGLTGVGGDYILEKLKKEAYGDDG